MKKNQIILMALCAVLCGCHTHNHGSHEGHVHGETTEAHDHEEAHEHHEGEIEISQERQEALGIRTETVTVGEFSGVVRTTGQILSASGDEMTVVAKSDGIVLLAGLTEGSAIGKGSRIATVSSSNLGSGDVLVKAKAAYEAARKEYERDLQLSEDNIVSDSHLDKSRMDYEYAKAEYDALTSGGVTEGGVLVTSPLGGFIKSLHVKNGDFVGTGTPIATVSQNRRLRLRADLPEKYYGLLGSIRDANFRTSYSETTYNLKELGGRLTGYGRASEGDCYIPVTFEFDNKGDLVSGSYVEIFLKTAASQEAVSIPLKAVVEDQGVHYVFVRHDEDAFLKREVSLGQSDGEMVLVKGGLSEGEEIVTDGAIHVKLAGVTAVPAGHTHNH